MPYLFSMDYFVVSYYSGLTFFFSFPLIPIICTLLALWLAIHMTGISLSWLATKWLFVYHLRLLVTPAFNSAESPLLFGLRLLFTGWSLLAPFSFIILSFRLLENCWDVPPIRFFRTRRFLQTIFGSVSTRLPFGILPGWIRDSWPIKVTKICECSTASVITFLIP